MNFTMNAYFEVQITDLGHGHPYVRVLANGGHILIGEYESGFGSTLLECVQKAAQDIVNRYEEKGAN